MYLCPSPDNSNKFNPYCLHHAFLLRHPPSVKKRPILPLTKLFLFLIWPSFHSLKFGLKTSVMDLDPLGSEIVRNFRI
jgi:hypothetical protein